MLYYINGSNLQAADDSNNTKTATTAIHVPGATSIASFSRFSTSQFWFYSNGQADGNGGVLYGGAAGTFANLNLDIGRGRTTSSFD